jgi:argininosuccinate lyase
VTACSPRPEGFLEATDLADYLAVRGMPFVRLTDRRRIVRYCIEQDSTLPGEHVGRQFSTLFDQGVRDILQPQAIVRRRATLGCTARARFMAPSKGRRTL